MQFSRTFFIKSLRKKEFYFVLISFAYMLCALFLSALLYFYRATDQSLFYVSSESSTMSLMRMISSYIISPLLFLLGSASMLLIPLLFFFAYLSWHEILLSAVWDRIVAAFIAILCCSLLGAWYKIKCIHSFFLPGGIIGSSIIGWLVNHLDPLTLILSLNALLFITFSYASQLTLVRFLFYAGFVKRISLVCIYMVVYIINILFKIIYLPFRWWRCKYDALVKRESFREFDFENIIHEQLSVFPHDELKEQSVIIEKTDNTSSQQTIDQFKIPSSHFFEIRENKYEQRQLHAQELATTLEQKLQRFGIAGQVVAIKTGPVVTLFEYQPDIDSKISKIIALEDDLALALQALSIRIIAPIPGRSVVGFEVSNKVRIPVHFATLNHLQEFTDSNAQLPLILGVDTIGNPVIADLATMPHLLLAGATGSGKSVALNTMLCSLLCKRTPEELRLILIDPKRIEFAPYADIPHLLFPIVTNPKHAVSILKWLLTIMQERYEILAHAGVRNINDYVKLPSEKQEQKLYSIVLMIDELADLMLVSGREIEESIARIAQMARAAGIHMIVATQRPSVDVITGTIKVNFPCRLSCRVVSKVDSRTILDATGADKLLGKGDMLYLDTANPLRRVHGAFISDKEIEQLAAFWKNQKLADYIDEQEIIINSNDAVDPEDEQLFQEVVEFLETIDEVSISLLQRRFRIGYNRSARIIELLEAQGRILSSDGGKTRKVLK